MVLQLGDKMNVEKEPAPSIFLTVLGIENEKYIGSPKIVWPSPFSKVYDAVLKKSESAGSARLISGGSVIYGSPLATASCLYAA